MKQLIPKEFRKLTPEEAFNKRVEDLYLTAIKVEGKGFTELETVQIANAFRRKLHEHLEEKQNHCMEQAVHFNQRANEIKEALSYLT
jgi:hypothetical protein